MKCLIASLALLCVIALTVPAFAANVYDNGPVNGESDAWTINFGLIVTDSFTVSNGNGNIGGIDFYAWLIPGDSITSVQVQIGSQEFGNNLLDTFTTLTQSNCFANNYGYNVCMESGTFSGVNLANGNYWVTLQNANVPSGDPVYWDENSGIGCQSQGCPSQADCNSCITRQLIYSEAFTLTGQSTTTTTTGTTPEPGSFLLFGSGFLVVIGFLRRKLF
ncbi:MAG: PEP-CTERM sorting domain-containing protein [Candidatus Korobacteraceae bacterium]